jgi:ABC-2 type transport system permease protein
MAICFLLTTIDRMLFFFPQATLAVLGYLGAASHFQNIAKGIIDSRDIIYFLSVVFMGLYGTALVMEEKN